MYELWVVIVAAGIGFIFGTMTGIRYEIAMQELDKDWRDMD